LVLRDDEPSAKETCLHPDDRFQALRIDVMARSFGVVEDKLYETEFFLDRLRCAARSSFEANCYFSAFVSAARSVTFAIQASLQGVPGFKEWYDIAKMGLKTDPLAPFFLEIRNQVVHTGANPLNCVSLDHLREDLALQLHQGARGHVLVLPDLRSQDTTVLVNALEACDKYFTSLISVVYECYSVFKTVVDGRWYFTEANFSSMSKTFEDAVVELGFPPDWAACAPAGNERWRVIRSQQPPCLINGIFERFLGKTIPDPDVVGERQTGQCT
jgi:hypothetical protein